jgi:hypothetical protein
VHRGMGTDMTCGVKYPFVSFDELSGDMNLTCGVVLGVVEVADVCDSDDFDGVCCGDGLAESFVGVALAVEDCKVAGEGVTDDGEEEVFRF